MNDLLDLIPLWARAAPNECHYEPETGSFELLGMDGMHVHGIERFVDVLDCDTLSAILGAVVYHAARRGLCLGMETGPFDSGWSADARAWAPARHASRALPYVSEPVGAGNGLSALRALATATLRAYLSALTTD